MTITLKVDKLLILSKNISPSKYFDDWMKSQVSDGKLVFANYISDKQPVSRIYKEFSKFKRKNKIKQCNWVAKDMRYFPQEAVQASQSAEKHAHHYEPSGKFKLK